MRSLMVSFKLTWLAVPALLAIACGDSSSQAPTPEECDPPSSPAAFEIGTGELCFERLNDGDTLPQMNGPQGGYHLFLAVGCNDCGTSATVTTDVVDAETMTAIGSPTDAFVELSDNDWPQAAGVQVGMPGFSWDDSDPPVAEGTAIVLHVVVKDSAGTVLHDEQRAVTLGAITPWDPCDAHPEGDCCSQACN